MSPVYLWLIFGAALLIADIHASGIGITFAGLGAIAVAITLHFGLLPPDSLLMQLIIFLIATGAWALLLWKPLQKWKIGRGHAHYSNMLGETAYAGSNGITKNSGEATWSGTIMQARIAGGAHERIEAGAPVIIQDVKGATLFVSPKN